MKFSEWMQTHRRSILFLFSLLVAGGLLVAWKLPVSLFPQVSFPRVVIHLDAGDQPAELMAINVTWPVEDAVRAVPGVQNLRSTSSRGGSEIAINFKWGRDMLAATLQIESAVNQILPSLPSGTTFTVERMDPTVFPVISYSLVSDTTHLADLRDIALYQLRPLLSTIPGVAQINVLGGETEEFRVEVDPAKLEAHNLTLEDVSAALSAAHVRTAVGRIEEHYKLYLTMVDNQFRNAEDIGETVIRKEGSLSLVKLKDIATISWQPAPQWTRVTADGHDAVLVQVNQQPEGNTVAIDQAAREKLKAFESQLPSGVTLSKWYDQSELILGAGHSVVDAIGVGLVLACLILMVFLRNWKITLIAIICVPAVLTATVLLLHALHMSFNMMTLGGMAAAVGLIIDDAIVMVEHVVRRLRGQTGQAHHGRILQAAAEFTRPLAGSSACTIVIFLPLAFLSSVTGAFFKALSLTMAASLIISFFIVQLAVPLLADHLLKQKDADQKESGRFMDQIHSRYERLMKHLLARPKLILIAIIPLLVFGWIGYRHVGSGFMPTIDEGGFILDYVAPPGTSLTETDRLLRQLETILGEDPSVETYSRRTGVQLGGGLTEANEGDYFIRLKTGKRPPIETVMNRIRERINTEVPGLEIEMFQLMEDLIGDLTAVPQPIEIKLYCDNEKILEETAPKVAELIQSIPGVVDVFDGIVTAGDGLMIRVDSAKAALEGMDAASITETVSHLLSGQVVGQVQQAPKMIDVRVWIPENQRNTAADVGALRLRAPDGHIFPLSRVASIQTEVGQPQIMRDNLKQMVAVTGRISGRDLGSAMRDVVATMSKPGILPKNATYELGGTYAQQREAFSGLMAVLASAVALVFLVLIFLYERFRTALAMLFCTLLALGAVMIGLWITGTELNISSMMGMTMVVGIATEVAVFLVSEIHELRQSGGLSSDETALIIEAGRNRIRPIAMTTLAAILALSPLALGIGQGSAMQQPLAIAIVFGLIAQFPLVLIVLPVLLKVVNPRSGNDNALDGSGRSARLFFGD